MIYEIYDDLKNNQPQETLGGIRYDWSKGDRHGFIVKYYSKAEPIICKKLVMLAQDIAKYELPSDVCEEVESIYDYIYEIIGEFYEHECVLLGI